MRKFVITMLKIENTYEGTYDLRGSKKFHLRDHPMAQAAVKQT